MRVLPFTLVDVAQTDCVRTQGHRWHDAWKRHAVSIRRTLHKKSSVLFPGVFLWMQSRNQAVLKPVAYGCGVSNRKSQPLRRNVTNDAFMPFQNGKPGSEHP